jgi:8-oxo-dGTP pyrophosphatase MutT (NUDIX family)
VSSADAKARIRPRDAAVLVIFRRDADGARVLMGQRHGGHVFMPNKFVFPGGRVDRADSALAARFELRGDVEARVAHGCSPLRARALALAAIRETYEETGLLVGRRSDAPAPRTRSAPWRAYFRHALVPPLEALEFVARAITPPANPRRFDTRLFLIDAAHVRGEGADALAGSGELLDLHWVPVADARSLDVPEVTAMVIGEVEKRLASVEPAALPAPFVRYTRAGFRLERL